MYMGYSYGYTGNLCLIQLYSNRINQSFKLSQILPVVKYKWDLLQMPYNVERLLLLASDLNTSKISTIMAQFDDTKAVNIPDELLRSVNEMITGYIANFVTLNEFLAWIIIMTLNIW